jgi:large subunit ribosomal protein L3
MTIGLLGKKCGMTCVYTEDGAAIPVSVIEVLPNRITQIKTLENDGYTAVQVTTGNRKRTNLNKAELGHYAKANVEAGDGLWEFRIQGSDKEQLDQFTLGAELKLDRFSEGQFVDLTGVTKGKGFAGTIKRHHFSSQDATHGNSRSHRVPGSIGQRQSPGKVFKGKRMSGQLGNVVRTIQSQQIIRIDSANNLILVKGAIPGAANAYVIIRPAAKKNA